MKRFTLSMMLVAVTMMVSAQKQIPLLDAAPYDTIMDGKKVALYTISNGTVAAQITNYGGFIVGLFAPDKSGEYANLVTNYPNIHQYPRYNLGMVGPALGRFANRIANATFALDGKEYQVTRNSGQHILHGGTQGFDHTVWDVVKADEKELVMKCVLADGLDGFPGTLTTTLTYSITKDNGLSIAYEATTDKATVVNLSNHSYFNLKGVGNGDILDHMLTVSAANITETDRMGIPTGKLTPVAGTAYDFNKPVKIGDRQVAVQGGFGFGFGQRVEIPEGKVRNYDNNFCLTHKDAKKVEKVAELYSPESGRVMEVWNDQPGLQVYTGARTAIALESQKYPDSPNHPEFPSTRLNPGETYHHTCIYRFAVK
jgi:aldose 1-epimerase